MEILIGILVLSLVVGVLLAFVVGSLWVSRRTSHKGALAVQHVALGQPFEMAVPAGSAFEVLLSYGVAGPGTAKNPLYGLAVHIEVTRGSFALSEQVVIGRSDATASTAPKVRAEWILGEHNSHDGKGLVESTAAVRVAHVAAGDACTVRGRIGLANGTQGRGFTVFAKPTKAAPAPRTAKQPGAAKQTGPGLVSLILGPVVCIALVAGAAQVALVSCTETVELLEGPGEPAVVVASEVRYLGKHTWLFIDVRAEDGTLWTAKCDPEEVPSLPSGHRTKMFRRREAEQGARYAGAFIAEQRNDELSGAKIGRSVLLYGVIPLIVIVGSWAQWTDMRTYRRRRRQSQNTVTGT